MMIHDVNMLTSAFYKRLGYNRFRVCAPPPGSMAYRRSTANTDVSSSPSSPPTTVSSSTSSASFSLDKSRQYISALSILAVALFVGLPVWWKTTEVYRRPLPYKEINTLSNKQVPSVLTFQLMVTYLNSSDIGDSVEAFTRQLNKELVESSVASGNVRIQLNYRAEVSDVGNSWKEEVTPTLQNYSLKEVGSKLERYFYTSIGLYYLIFISKELLPDDCPISGEKNTMYVNQFRHTLVGVDFNEDLSVYIPAALKLFKHVYMERKHIEKALKNTFASQKDRVDMENKRRMRVAEGYHIAITLLNPDPADFNTSWNVVETTRSILLPFLRQEAIAPLGRFTISSQVFYYTDVKFKAKKDKDSFYVLSSQLPPMISSVESKLASHVSQHSSLNFLVYIPKKSEYPLHIRESSKSSKSTDTFLVAQWGGVMIYNPPELAQLKAFQSQRQGNRTVSEDGVDSGERSLLDSKGTLKVAVNMEQVMPVFVQQLRMLFGVTRTEWPQGADGVNFLYERGELGLAIWETDHVLVSKMLERVHVTTTSLISLVQLLGKVKNMVIGDEIQREVEASLNYILQCYICASRGDIYGSHLYSNLAMTYSEKAFFDPSILELLYFPDDQKFAIYIPLFLPISVPILLSSVAALKWLAAAFKSKDVNVVATSQDGEKESRERKESESSCPSTCDSEDLEQSEEDEHSTSVNK